MKKLGFIVYCLILSIIFLAPSKKIWSQTPTSTAVQYPKITASTIVEDLKQMKKQNPEMTPRELADYGNKLLSEKGFTYIFDVCKFLKENGQYLPPQKGVFFQPFLIQLTTVTGERKSFEIAANYPMKMGKDKADDGCFTQIAVSRITGQEMTVLADGQPVRLQRPKDFRLGKILLSNKDSKKVVRQWETPFLIQPSGVSTDEKKLYLAILFEGLYELVLEVSENDSLQFRARNVADKEYISFEDFLQTKKSYTIDYVVSEHFMIVVALGLFTPPEKIYPLETKPLSPRNPTSYEFAYSVSEVRGKLLTAFENFDQQAKLASSFDAQSRFRPQVESRETALFSKEIFADPENKNDLYLHAFGEFVGPSPIYSGGGKPLKYRSEFQLHLTDAGHNRTKVSVITHKPTVFNGSKCCGLHGYVSNDVPVEPTTIEEYKILLFIGSILGTKNMPPLRMPEDD